MYDESLCRRCGKCCYEKIEVNDELYLTDVPCQYLDPHTKLCTVYERRHDENIRCLSVERGIKVRAFPGDCPYVRDIPGYRPPLPAEGAPELAQILKDLRAAAEENLDD